MTYKVERTIEILIDTEQVFIFTLFAAKELDYINVFKNVKTQQYFTAYFIMHFGVIGIHIKRLTRALPTVRPQIPN